jgi:glycolate oxidase
VTQAALSDRLLDAVRAACGPGGTIEEPERLRTYECDGLTGHRAIPALVCLPPAAEAVQAVVRACHAEGVPFVARGAGTGLSGGALPVVGGVVISVARMRRILEIDLDGGRVTVEPGVANLEVTRAVAPHGYYYAPDPSSQQVCTIGGNVAENSGGAHCLKHGFTVNHVCGLSVVLSDGELVELGGEGLDEPGPDLLGVFVGSEGTLGIAVRVTLRIVRRPEQITTFMASFDSTDEAGGAVSDIVAAGILPAAIEMMDRLTIEAAEAAVHAGYPEGAGAILITELDGVSEQVAEDMRVVEEICRRNGSTEIRVAHGDAERAIIWKGRKAAFAAVGRISPDYYVQDGVVPRTQLPAVLRRIQALSVEHGLRVGNVFHAGDGNLHPLVLYDGAVEGEAERAELCARAILTACVEAGGAITGEHDVGVDKACAMPLMFTPDDLAVMDRVRRAFDPDGLANPGKLLPTPRLCGEAPGPHRMHPLERAGVVERL